MPRIPSVIRNFTLMRVGDPTVFLGIADVELPTFSALTAELAGSGLLGKSDVTVPGHFSNVAAKVTLHTPDQEFVDLCYFDGDTLEARGIIQGKDTATGKRYSSALKVVMVVDGTKTASPGKLEAGVKTDSNVDLVISYVAYYIDIVEVLLWDFYNYVYRVNGVDVLSKDRTMLGIS